MTEKDFIELAEDPNYTIEETLKIAYENGRNEVLEKLRNAKSELWMEGVNMTDEYQGVWVRYRNIEKSLDEILGEKRDD